MSDLGIRSSAEEGASIPTEGLSGPVLIGIDYCSDYIRDVIAGLTKVQRMYVVDGCIHGDCQMVTVRALKRKGLFRLVIDSPNGRAGFMRLTSLGEAVQANLKRRAATRVADSASPGPSGYEADAIGGVKPKQPTSTQEGVKP